MKVLVTGSKGFIGKHLCRRLKEAAIDVVGCVKTYGEHPDVSDLNMLKALEKVDVIVHLAAKSSVTNSISSPYETYHTNVLGTLNLLELARLKNIPKFIFSSTYVYGHAKYLPIDEKHPVNPHSHYHHSKLIAEQLCENYSKSFGIDMATLRLFYIYGPECKSTTFIPSVISQINKNGKVLLSGALTRRDFLFVDDFTSLIVSILNNFPDNYNLYNVGSGKSYTLKETALLLANLLHKKITIEYINKMRPGDIIKMTADISKVSNKFNWKPPIGLEKGLELTINDPNYQRTC